MTKTFDDLAKSIKAGWPDNVHRVYEAVASEFAAEVAERGELGARLAAARKARGLTQPALSALTGVQQAEISRIERGLSDPTATTLLRLARALEQKVVLVPAE